MILKQLKGTKAYLGDEQLVREKIIDILKKIFKKYGYKPIETSILEFYDIASSKYGGGEEILKETYRLKDQGNRELCLRYELTFKLAKLIGLNPSIRMPFKRYEIGKVFRDGPVKKGRLREFTQCDVDCVGIKSLVVDAEYITMIFEIFSRLKLDVYILINNRRVLFGLFKLAGFDSKDFVDIALSLDKLEKFGKAYVIKELQDKKLDKRRINKLFSILEEIDSKNNNEAKIKYIEEIIKEIATRNKDNELKEDKILNKELEEGLKEIKEFFYYLDLFIPKENKKDIIFLPTLARGLGYYTGMVWEVYLKDSEIKSSVAAGGRWDRMIGKFLDSKIEYPATGITFGLDVIFTAMKSLKEKKLNRLEKIPQVLIIPINTLDECIRIVSRLRKKDINSDIAYGKKLTKALDYANKENVPFCIIIGEEEAKEKKVRLKNMYSGKEELLTLEEVIKKMKNIKNKGSI